MLSEVHDAGDVFLDLYCLVTAVFLIVLLAKTVFHLNEMVTHFDDLERKGHCGKFFLCLAVWTFMIMTWVQLSHMQ